MDGALDRRGPVVEAYKKDIDRTLIRENLKLTVEERFRKAMALKSLESPYSSAGAAWMAAELVPGALDGIAGTVCYPGCLQRPFRERSGSAGPIVQPARQSLTTVSGIVPGAVG